MSFIYLCVIDRFNTRCITMEFLYNVSVATTRNGFHGDAYINVKNSDETPDFSCFVRFLVKKEMKSALFCLVLLRGFCFKQRYLALIYRLVGASACD